MAVFWESLVFSQNSQQSRAYMTLGPHFMLAGSHPIVEHYKHCLLLPGTDRFSHGGKHQQHQIFSESFSKKEIVSENWTPSGKPRKGLYKSCRKDRKASVWGGSSLPWMSKSISEEMPVESMNIPMESFSCHIITIWTAILFQCTN